jgi:putative Mg2+ transporter-C (MgtC) family protein
VNPYGWTFWVEIGIAILCGSLIGFERQFRGKPAGIRTSILICLGTEIFVALGKSFAITAADPTRVLGQVVTGIGFLGAGVILTSRGGRVTGVTSAAVIWVLAAIGATIGLDYFGPAAVMAVITVGILAGIELLESRVLHLQKGVHAREEQRKGPKEPGLRPPA